MGVDRTAEFFSVVETLAREDGTLDGLDDASPLLRKQPEKNFTPSQFTQAAAHISRGIFGTTSKLEKLAKLAKQRSLYEDKSSEINEVTFVIKNDLQTINNELAVLHQFVTESQNRNTKHSAQNSTAIVDNLKLQLATTTKSFAEVLQIRTKNLKEQNSRRQYFESSSPVKLPRRKVKSFGITIEEEKKDGEGGDVEAPVQLQAVQQEEHYLTSRAQAVESIESTIAEIGNMYQKLTNIVSLHQEMTVRIDENMDNALVNVEAGYGQLVKANDRLSGNQWLILKIFAVLIAFAVFFVIFVA